MKTRGPNIKNAVNLSDQERMHLLHMTRYGERPAREIHRAHILLLSDQGMPNAQIEKTLQASRATIIQVQQRYAKKGLQISLTDKKRSGRPKIWTKKDKRLLLKVLEEQPPHNRPRWTLRTIKQRFLELSTRESISHEQIRQILHAEGINWMSKQK